jgi:hypothetical protein
MAAFGQLNNQPFEQRMTVEQPDSNRLFLGINWLGFGKNNEYFDTTVDGYTLFGYQLNPYVSYHIAKNVRLDAGVFAQKDFGNDAYTQVMPTLSLKVTSGRFGFIFGTLESSLNHQLIEPLYDFERVLTNRLENGMQLLWISDGFFMDAWADWQNMIYQNDPEQERFVAGMSVNKTLLRSGKVSISVPVQCVADHRGGQIDVSTDPVVTRVNAALGLTAEVRATGFITSWGIKSYLTGYRTSDNQAAFKDGHGIFINPYVNTKTGLSVMGSYWRGDQFLTIQGGQLYPSISEDYPARVDEVREFFMLRFLYDLSLADGLTLTLRAEPFYDTYAEAVEYAFGVYLNFSDRFFLVNAKKGR